MGHEGSQITIAGKLESSINDKESRNKPGPGSYEYFATSTLRSMPAYKIGTSKRTESMPKGSLHNPDPGAYDPST
jgi:hypothetical protein